MFLITEQWCHLKIYHRQLNMPLLVFEMLDYTSSFLFFRDNNPSTVLMLVTVCQIENGETSRLLKSVKLV